MPLGDRITVLRTLLGLGAVVTMLDGQVLEGLCLLGVLVIWAVSWPDPHRVGRDR